MSGREEKEALRGIALLLVIAKAVEGVILRFVQVGLGGRLVTFLMFGVGNSIILKFLIYFVCGLGVYMALCMVVRGQLVISGTCVSRIKHRPSGPAASTFTHRAV